MVTDRNEALVKKIIATLWLFSYSYSNHDAQSYGSLPSLEHHAHLQKQGTENRT